MGDMGGREEAAVALVSGFDAGTLPSAIFSASCRITALPGDSSEFTQTWSLGDSLGNGENDSGDGTGNGEAPWFDRGE